MRDVKSEMIHRIKTSVQDIGEQIRKNENLSVEDKLIQTDVLLDTLKFLYNYDENVQALNNYYTNKNRNNKER